MRKKIPVEWRMFLASRSMYDQGGFWRSVLLARFAPADEAKP